MIKSPFKGAFLKKNIHNY